MAYGTVGAVITKVDIIFCMAREAIQGSSLKNFVNMATLTGDIYMFTVQLENR